MGGLTRKEINEIFGKVNAQIKDYRSRTQESYKEEWPTRFHEIYYGDQERASGMIHVENLIIEKLLEKEAKEKKKMLKA